MLTRFILVALLGLVCEGGVFAYTHRDILELRRTAPLTSPAERAAFADRAERALLRKSITRADLELIAAQAQRLGLAPLEIRALDACAALDPDDLRLSLRRAEAFRRAGDLRRAEQIYKELLRRTPRRTS